MNRMQILCTCLFICLTLSIAIYGIVEEAEILGRTNQIAYGLIVTPSLSMTAGLVNKPRGLKTLFKKSFLMMILSFIFLGLLGRIYYEGFKEGFVEWGRALVFQVLEFLFAL
ncbi:hypothetical protein ACFOU2_17030 [Bacillus songklensis]|uniref:Uncharacterized protein n=1 Tax=Bacillus songklensis TaxID=1069116 RepID=A0ABV8B6S0_9BACI